MDVSCYHGKTGHKVVTQHHPGLFQTDISEQRQDSRCAVQAFLERKQAMPR